MNGPLLGPVTLLQADARKLPLADESVQCIVTSPPYWGLRKYAGEQELIWGGEFCPRAHRENWPHEWGETVVCSACGAWRGGYGLEPTIEMYLDHTREILRELWRVLRHDGVLFWNIGDSYAAGKIGRADSERNNVDGFTGSQKYKTEGFTQRKATDNLKPKDLCLIPERVALAAQADGWWVRSRILWCKPNPMPERVTDRPTDAAEHIWMLTKSERYYWDADAVREPASEGTDLGILRSRSHIGPGADPDRVSWHAPSIASRQKAGIDSRNGNPSASRNLRNVWNFPTQPYPEAHFATFPEELPRRCILAATSAKGACAQCGAPWERVVKASGGLIGQGWHDHSDDATRGNMPDIEARKKSLDGTYRRDEIGWTPTCRCRGQHGRTQPCVVLDPFGGSGTTGRVAIELRRRAVLCDIAYGEKDVYRALAEDRTSEVDVQLPFL